MRKTINLVTLAFMLIFINASSQTVRGKVISEGKAVSFANIVIKGVDSGVSADEYGDYIIENIPLGYQYIIVSAIGMKDKTSYCEIQKGVNIINIELNPLVYHLDQVVITGTKTFKRIAHSPVVVNVMDAKQLESVQACNLAEGLNFQPGLRVENDCQTCNYTQLRINGLDGGYSQILINGRPIFSPLTGLYGLEQIPINMIHRIEIVRGGGSALYGSSAIGGVANVITKLPTSNNYSFSYDYSRINGVANDMYIHGDAAILSKSRNSGATFFVKKRDREWYDHNTDNFSELPALDDNAFGANFFFLPSVNKRLEFNICSLHEYRYGGEMLSFAPHFSMQSEERVHDVLVGNLDYQVNFNSNNSSFISYLAAQKTDRDHYTGIRPEIGTDEDAEHLSIPPYGSSLNTTMQAGFQLNHKVNRLFGPNVYTLGSEYLFDDVMDEISAYNYLIDQKVTTFGVFFQSDWELTENFNLLSGARFDKHSLLEDIVVSPRLSLLYRLKKRTQFRVSYSTGFRAPQAFDTDLHIAFAGGGVSRIILDDNLKEERSKSLSTSINYDKAAENYIYGFTLEGFYTYLDDAFYQDFLIEDEFGKVFVKRNGTGAFVEGFTVEFRANLMQKLQIESGFTFQRSMHEEAVIYSEDLKEKKEFLRTPRKYGYTTFSYRPDGRWTFSANLVHTGEMDLIHLAGSPDQVQDEFFVSPVFNTIGLKWGYTQKMNSVGAALEYSVGVKNLTNAFQQDFDTLKQRDSNFVYGPSSPRTVYLGLTLKSL